ncbi:MAG TPA: Hpt domain-containing protein [Flavobacteriaceae bacterium]|nr:Hpt domain-containing protein [Flavobacteriaceae bacterium]HPF11631.1 Hpt domain-containing protein [Flavobacteriaceae bacterium]HQU20106.1 Hpt domain-containing protein [Flavobacteriaceae bacterium]HQU64805.1 Hpt domain-containing protein [Flavobacteriaceae bacterium]HRW43467.1 Hpt domain-containing protein [Flavobacteriaceae bacterium]
MSKLYSIDSLKEIAGDDADFMGVVAQTFLDEIPPDLKAMVEAVENDNRELAYQFAHKMKPNIEMFGIDLLKQITGIESWTKTSKNINSIQTMVDEVNATLHEVFEQLKSDFNL